MRPTKFLQWLNEDTLCPKLSKEGAAKTDQSARVVLAYNCKRYSKRGTSQFNDLAWRFEGQKFKVLFLYLVQTALCRVTTVLLGISQYRNDHFNTYGRRESFISYRNKFVSLMEIYQCK